MTLSEASPFGLLTEIHGVVDESESVKPRILATTRTFRVVVGLVRSGWPDGVEAMEMKGSESVCESRESQKEWNLRERVYNRYRPLIFLPSPRAHFRQSWRSCRYRTGPGQWRLGQGVWGRRRVTASQRAYRNRSCRCRGGVLPWVPCRWSSSPPEPHATSRTPKPPQEQ